ncbi:class I SAM-dependent methyltransferase [Xanthovirga aplysinae]|uniref:class I SAM-dependent methyltransferase n=1 Tax=Xanthovirga aplysinae TaxID=2529853 RepID=UPI0012BB56BB|nr:class I SAM-dependent methyltransferase [Xanthovirga aplysinae]MTI32549.1 class I SAM-dependent methyltransferase [Xanthovirga aplysinae]
MNFKELNNELGNIDLYLLDQILKGRYLPEMKILDAGCGEGRNLIWFLKNGYEVYGIDQNPSAVLMLQYLARTISRKNEKERFITSKVENLPYLDHAFDAVISNAVLHFANNRIHFLRMFGELMRVLKPKGSIFIRMASAIHPPFELEDKGEGKFRLPDESVRFLLTEQLLHEIMGDFPLRFLEPMKTVNVDNVRLMSTLVLEKQE